MTAEITQPPGHDGGARDATLPDEPADQVPSSPNRSAASPLGRTLWPIICLFQLGLSIGLFSVWRRTAPPASADPRSEATVDAAADESLAHRLDVHGLSSPRLNDTARADELLRQGRPELALAIFQDVADECGGQLPDSLRLRVALCQESLGWLDRAAATYAELGARSHFPIESLALLGEARAKLMMTQPRNAKELSRRVMARTAQPRLGNSPVIAEANHILGLALAREILGYVEPGALNDALAPPTLSLVRPEVWLEWLAGENETAVQSGDAETMAIVLKRADGTAASDSPGARLDQGHDQDGDSAAAEAALNHAVSTFPQSRFTPASLLELGNLALLRNDAPAAIETFQRILRDFPRSETVASVYFNIAVARRRSGDIRAAREALLRLVDSAPGHSHAPIAHLEIGRMYLSDGDWQRAIAPLRRAQSSAGLECRSAAALALATDYLLVDNPRAASAVIAEHREQLSQPPFRNVAAFLSALSRVRSRIGRAQAQRDKPELLAALLACHDDPLLGPAGALLMGQAYRELAMDDRMAAVYDAALEHGVSEPLRSEMALAVAEAAVTHGEIASAVDRLTALADSENRPLAARATLRLAEIHLAEGRPDPCRELCRKLLEQDTLDINSILKLMGRAYEQTGDHRNAATCFSGRSPEP